MKRSFTLFFLLAIIFRVNAQNQNNQWHFGKGAAISFSESTPKLLSGSKMDTYEGCASVADPVTGELLFYTNGVKVWDAEHQVMPNGNGLLGHISSTTSAVIIPKPGSKHLYYIVCIDALENSSFSSGINYSLVDMSLNNGLGDIVSGQKNKFLFETTTEKLEVVPAADGKSLWLITRINFQGFYAFRVTGNGILPAPVFSALGISDDVGQMKMNRQYNQLAMGSKWAINNAGASIQVFDFNNATGVFSNERSLRYDFDYSAPYGIYGVEFSPSGKFLYVSDFYRVVQFNLGLSDIQAIQKSGFRISPQTSFLAGGLQLGPDGRIYGKGTNVFAINYPEKSGTACNFTEKAFSVMPDLQGIALPKWVYFCDDFPGFAYFNYRTGQDPCPGAETVNFSLRNNVTGATVLWDFGDPSSGVFNTSVEKNPVHVYIKPGIYRVKVHIKYAGGTETLEQQIYLLRCRDPDEACSLNIPNAITPNGDNLNDAFIPLATCPLAAYHLQIFNRTGQSVFTSSSHSAAWPASSDEVPEGGTIFFYTLTYQFEGGETKKSNGFFTVLR